MTIQVYCLKTGGGEAALPSIAYNRVMRNVVLGVGISLDGYIASHDGAVDWLKPDPAYDFEAFFKTIDACILGRKTLDVALGMGGKGQFGSSKMPAYVFSRSKPAKLPKGTTLVNEPPGEFIRKLKAQPGKDIWLMGGGELAREFLKEDVVDRIDLGVMPLLLGDGIPLFPAGFPQRQFHLVKSKSYPSGLLELSYTRAR